MSDLLTNQCNQQKLFFRLSLVGRPVERKSILVAAYQGWFLLRNNSLDTIGKDDLEAAKWQTTST